MDDPTLVSILILGDSGCGKSTFLSRLSVGQQSPTRNPNHAQEQAGDKAPVPVLRDLDQPFIYNVRLHRRPYRLEFYDTSYTHQHWTLLQPDFVILAFDLTSREGLERLKGVSDPMYCYGCVLLVLRSCIGWRNDVIRHFQRTPTDGSTHGERIPVMVLGLKRDLRVENSTTIYPQEGYRIAQELRCDRYAECSAITGELIPEVFEDIATVAAKTTTEAGGQSKGGCVVM
ncbi:hypothetical protein FQN52_005986 [Onygenales sp. PD_12]|nr:hypothetical protein FQN52_005986 [Onygenales sp. PD_12]